MKISLYIMFFLLFITTISNANLIEINNANGHTVFDTKTKKYWIWDLSDFSFKTYEDQIEHIKNNYADKEYNKISSWHMASLEEMQGLWSYSFDDLIIFNPVKYTEFDAFLWWGRYNEVFPHIDPSHRTAALWLYQDGRKIKSQLISGGAADWVAHGSEMGAWVVSDSHPHAPVPEPGTVLLLGSGLAGLALYRRRKNKS